MKFVAPQPVYYWINNSMKVICKNCNHSINYHNYERTPHCFYENCHCIEGMPHILEINGVPVE